jgi:hypothetical protein
MSTVDQRPPIYKYVDYQAITSIDGLDQSVRNLAAVWLCIDHPRYAAYMAGLRTLLENGHEVVAMPDHETVHVDGVVMGVERLAGFCE